MKRYALYEFTDESDPTEEQKWRDGAGIMMFCPVCGSTQVVPHASTVMHHCCRSHNPGGNYVYENVPLEPAIKRPLSERPKTYYERVTEAQRK